MQDLYLLNAGLNVYKQEFIIGNKTDDWFVINCEFISICIHRCVKFKYFCVKLYNFIIYMHILLSFRKFTIFLAKLLRRHILFSL